MHQRRTNSKLWCTSPVCAIIPAGECSDTDSEWICDIWEMLMILTSISDAMKLIGLLPLNYICFRCRIPGHHIKHCPSNGVTGLWEITAAVNLSSLVWVWISFMNSQDRCCAPHKRMRKCAGIPRSFLLEVDDPDRKGVMMDSSGKYVIPVMDAWVYCTCSSVC